MPAQRDEVPFRCHVARNHNLLVARRALSGTMGCGASTLAAREEAVKALEAAQASEAELEAAKREADRGDREGGRQR